MLTAFRQAIKVLSANPTRTLLTTLGIMIGIATVILVLSAGAGFRNLIDSQIASLGTNTLYVATKVPSANKSRASLPDTGSFSGLAITSLKQRDIDDIKKVPNVVNDYGAITGQAIASYRNNQKSVIYFGASAARFDIDQSTLKTGRFYTEAEDAGGAQVAILGSKLATTLFNADEPVGKLVHVGTLNFLVIGVYNPSSGLGGGMDDILFVPLATAQKKMLGINYVIRIIVQIKDLNLSDATANDIKNVLRHNHDINDPAKDDFMVATQTQVMDTFNIIFNGITILLIAIAAISLIVGGVGIMNIMYVVVTERTAEIGLKKALGAKNADILREFLIESILVTVLGGAIGIILGAVLGWLLAVVAIQNGLAWTFTLPFYAIAIGFGVSAAIGISFGVLPARSAAKLDPITALSHE
ncbi:MAG: ABC transporter permease [Candidatus Falkowbacteria bacterium]|nr:ABC transporter permease [Candidatus Falkowbacteria bacterium]